ncbi:hotdog fold thioesterase [Mongoliibacter ruber]|uniref:1,4-dihydroxy-2-naphthoyl-CoA hydrolase n=1 Tax=Mongoliibacter ruber TaxID=1750599 RepID=A0A2T0WMI0_9BACT|nr:hotdog fold thioesterase [Mongoliibacter ruber]PRY87913.1 1,4-dihydroxy-2-naphthoyl-CoA hydrolase [Mongoliibacter ruber]
MIFPSNLSLDLLNDWGKNTMTDFLDIKFTAIGEDYLEASMPVDHRTKQPLGLLHGGANVVLAETLGSVAATLTIDKEKQYCVGLEINANHLAAVKEGRVKGITKPIHLGKKTQVWEIKIYTEEGKLSCISRITMAVIDRK